MVKISGYTTVRNAVEMGFPLEASIRSLLSFCDEVVVVDSSTSNDGTTDLLQVLMSEDSRLNVYNVTVPWDAPNHGIYDGELKAKARSLCTGDYLWQNDADEVVEENAGTKIEALLKETNGLGVYQLLALPVIEYWGSQGKVRIDVNPWKWRLSKNVPEITHGIPAHLRWEKDGLLYAKHGTDGCDYIHSETGQIIPCGHFMTAEVENLRQRALHDLNAAKEYQTWFEMITEHLPTVHHFSWYSIADKIKKYRLFWNNSWHTLYGEEHPKGFNPFFQKSLDEVTDAQIDRLVATLEHETGGHIFHKPWDRERINAITLQRELPALIQPWAQKKQKECRVKNYIALAKKSFAQAERLKSNMHPAILNVPGMSGHKLLHFLNNIVQRIGGRYLEIGTWMGSTFCAALSNSETNQHCVACDNWSEFNDEKKVRDAFHYHVEKFVDHAKLNVSLLEGNCEDIEEEDLEIKEHGKFSVYFYDGAHGADDHFMALEHFIPFMTDTFVYLCDDWNWDPVEEGTRRALEELSLKVESEWVIRTPNDHDRAGWWNGFYCAVVSK